MRQIVCGVSLCMFLLTAHVRAQTLSLHQIRFELQRYDLSGTTTTDILQSLTTFIQQTNSDTEKNEARFLRAIVSSDLLLLARIRNDQALVDRVISALGTTQNQLNAFLSSELNALNSGYYAESVREALALMIPQSANAESLRNINGIRRDYFWIVNLSEQLSGTSNRTNTWSSLGQIPSQWTCTARCIQMIQTLDDESKKAFAATQDFYRAVRQINRARQENDPFAAALDNIDALVANIRSSPAQLSFLVPETISFAALSVDHISVSPDILISVQNGQLRWSFLPHIASDSHGAAILDAADPVFPLSNLIELPATFSDQVEPIESLASTFSNLFATKNIALSSSSAIEAHLIARVALTLKNAGAQISSVAGIDSQRRLRFMPIEVSERAIESAVSVFVRLGAYDVQIERSRLNLPRMREGTGFRFDTEGLTRGYRGRTFTDASIRFMHGVPWQSVMGAIERTTPQTTSTVKLILTP